MTAMKNKFLVWASALLVGALCAWSFEKSVGRTSEPDAVTADEYIYKADTGHRIDVFNLAKKVFAIEGDEYLSRRDGKYHGDIGGRILLCTTQEYFCIRGGIYAAVPRKLLGQTTWSSAGMACKADKGLDASASNVISCTFEGRSTLFTYEPKRGVVAYRDGKLELKAVGARGLFALP